MPYTSLNPLRVVQNFLRPKVTAPTYEQICRQFEQLIVQDESISWAGQFRREIRQFDPNVTTEKIRTLLTQISTLLEGPKSGLFQSEINHLQEIKRCLNARLTSLSLKDK